MAKFNTTFSEGGGTINTSFTDCGGNLIVDFGSGTPTLKAGQILSNTTIGWNSQPELISEARTIYVYTDYQTETDGSGNTVNIPGFKVGDGKAYVIDLPFTDELMVKHMANQSIHVTQEEKDFWNNKVRAYYSSIEEDTLILTVD